MILVLDNYDSFTFNLVQAIGSLGAEVMVVRNDDHTVDELAELTPDRVVVSPGPCTPTEAGVSIEAFRTLGASGVPMLGVCLGHQSLGEAFGGRTIRGDRIMHGKTGAVRHSGDDLFEGVPSPFTAARYHSLVTDPAALPEDLVPIAWSADEEDAGVVQAMRHRSLPLWGVQFHPESLFAEAGIDLLRNFLRLS
ncbi:MAG: aminodeoxychorismate/anthranilate synthase component II [Gemmatimonadota bacterium]